MSERWHFIGIGGSGMSAVARLAAASGRGVTGSNLAETAYFQALRDAGMDVVLGHTAEAVDGADEVVVSSAVRESNPELARARELGLPVLHRSEALARVLEGRRLVAVAGSHGKTTTSAMTAHILHRCGIDASFAVGARVFGVPGAVAGGYAGQAEIAVLEADESDGSFLRYQPEVAVLTNVEPDHLDHYGTVAALERAFEDFAGQAGVLVACGDDPRVGRIALAAAATGVTVLRYGRMAADVVVVEDGVVRDGEHYPMNVPIPGVHNRLNAAAAWTAAVAVGADPAQAAAAVADFAGTGRRYELRGEAAGVRVIDDYAHHPTEVAALLAAARADGVGRMVVLFQPALFSRTREHAQAFGAALSVPDADVVLAAVHGDREEPIEGVDSGLIAAAVEPREGSSVRVVEDLREAADVAVGLARAGDVVLTVGSGTVTQAAGWIVEGLREREGAGD